jgi:hypothetical protein
MNPNVRSSSNVVYSGTVMLLGTLRPQRTCVHRLVLVKHLSAASPWWLMDLGASCRQRTCLTTPYEMFANSEARSSIRCSHHPMSAATATLMCQTLSTSCVCEQS